MYVLIQYKLLFPIFLSIDLQGKYCPEYLLPVTSGFKKSYFIMWTTTIEVFFH